MKIKIAIVDDELTSRNTIKSYLENDKLYEVVADFSDGKTAIEWLRANEVDILLCDMQMPEMNGVEMMRLIHVINEYLPVIVISGFDDFNYLRGSLINGAANYLLKHELTREKLLEALEQVRDKYRIVPEERNIQYRTGYCILDEKAFTAENIREMTDSEKIDFNYNHLTAIAIGPDYVIPDGVKPKEYKTDICKAIQDMLSQILGNEYKYLVHIKKNNHLILLISFYHVSSTLYIMNVIKNLTERLQRLAVRMLDITLTIAYSDAQMELESAIMQIDKLEAILGDKLYLGGNRIIPQLLNKEIRYHDGDIEENLWKQLEFELDHHTNESVNLLKDIFSKAEGQRVTHEKICEICDQCLSILSSKNYIKDEERTHILERIREYEFFEQFKITILELYSRKLYAEAKEANVYSPLINKVVKYIQANFTSDISLEKCAEYVDTSYTHLSREFKKETGMRFVEYLNQLRINKAKSLLIRNDVTMKDIVEQAGFRNYNYFFKVFKESQGITPSEFMAKK